MWLPSGSPRACANFLRNYLVSSWSQASPSIPLGLLGADLFLLKRLLLHLCVVTRKGASLHSQQPKTSSPHPQHGSQRGKVEESWRGAESGQRSLSHSSGEQGYEYVQYLQSRSTCKSQQKKVHTLVLDETKSASELLCD